MVLLIDNYDSFSYNLVQLAGSLGAETKVVRNNEITIDKISELNPKHIILSPGPGYPNDAGVCKEIVTEMKGRYRYWVTGPPGNL